MTIANSHTIAGYLRTDGSTSRTITMVRVAGGVNSFTLRENLASQANPLLQQSVVHKTYEVRTKAGAVVRHASSEWRWPFEVAPGSGIVNPTPVTLNRTGIHIPAETPLNVRKDIHRQLSQMADSTAGTVGLLLSYGPMVLGDYPF